MFKIILIRKKNRGFVILFAVTISAIVLAIALGVANIAFQEVKFGTSARDTNDAFFAADTGAECALFYDGQNNFPLFNFNDSQSINCADSSITVPAPTHSNGWESVYSFDVSNLGSVGAGCSKVVVTKVEDQDTHERLTTITSKGYNVNTPCDGEGSSSNRIEKEISVSYTSSN